MTDTLRTKRLFGDMKLLRKDPVKDVDVYVDENNMLNWYFLIHGEKKSVYEGGEYIGEIMYPNNYPRSPPDFKMLTPSGRFAPGSKICLSNSTYHANEWSPEWTISGTIRAFLSIFNSDDTTGISHITTFEKSEKVKKEVIEDRKKFAKSSISYNKKKNADLYANILENKIEPMTEKEEKKAKKEFSKKEKTEKKAKKEDANDENEVCEVIIKKVGAQESKKTAPKPKKTVESDDSDNEEQKKPAKKKKVEETAEPTKKINLKKKSTKKAKKIVDSDESETDE